jgi:hypothetical protein
MMMARKLNKLTAKTVEKLTTPGRHADGGGLYLSISGDGRRRWVFLYRQRRAGETGAGKLREMGLGSARDVGLAQAREQAAKARAALQAGRNPLDLRNADRAIPTFSDMANEVASSRETAWRSAKHRQQWRSTLTVHAKALSHMRVDAITTDDVLRVLKPDGAIRRKRHYGCAGASRKFWMPPRQKVYAVAKIQPVGAGTSTTSCLPAQS